MFRLTSEIHRNCERNVRQAQRNPEHKSSDRIRRQLDQCSRRVNKLQESIAENSMEAL